MKIRPRVTIDELSDEERLKPSANGAIAPKRDFGPKSFNFKEWLLPVALSLSGHLAIILLFLCGLPSFWKKFPEEQVITFEMLPVTDVSNIKTQKVQKEKAVEAESAKKVQQTKAEKPKEEVKPEPPKPDLKPEPKPEPKPEAEKVKEEIKKKEEPKKVEKPKDTPKPKEVKKEPPKKKKAAETDLDSLLKTLEKSSEGKEEKSRKQALSEYSDAEHESKGEFDDKQALSISEYQAIRQQIERHWSVPVGAKDAGEIQITLYISLKSDGTVEHVKLVEQKCPPGNAILCQAGADSAIRAVWRASPLQGLSVERYNSWKEFNISFDPRDVAG